MAESTSSEISNRSNRSDQSPLNERTRVLVVDDEPGVRQVVRVNLVMQGHDVVEAKNGAQALKMIEENGIDLVILDLMMPKVSGWDVLEAVRKHRGSRAISIIVLSAVTTEDAKLRAFDLGAADYIIKPFAVGELLARVNRTLHERIEKQVLAEFSITDWVTGLFNRRYLELRLPQEVSRAHRYGRPLVGLFFEVDQLPRLLEERGPQFVDGILQEVATLVRGETRACDVLFRYDADYFVMLLPDTPLLGGIEVADRIRRRMLETEWHQEVGLSGSLGVIELEGGEDAGKFFSRCEDALLTAKRAGGNAVWPPKGELGEFSAVPVEGVGPVQEFPVEEGPPEAFLQQEIAPPPHAGLGDLRSSATQQTDPALLPQVQQGLGQESFGREMGGDLGVSSATAPASEPAVQGWEAPPTEQWAEPQPQEWPSVQQWAEPQPWEEAQQSRTEDHANQHPPYQAPAQ